MQIKTFSKDFRLHLCLIWD